MGSSISAGTDVERRAGELCEIREALLRGETPKHLPRPDVVSSWQRSRAAGLDPDVHDLPLLDRSTFLERVAAHPLAGIIDRIRQLFTDAVNDPHLMMGIFDADGVLIYRGGPDALLAIADTMTLVEGARWDEASAGTSAVSLVLATDRPELVFGAEHYSRRLWGMYCSAAPIHDRRSGETVAAVGVAGPASTVQPAATALTAAIAGLAEHELMAGHERALAELRITAAARLTGLSGPGMIVDNDGWVADSRGFTAPERVPAPTERTRQFVSGMGNCDVERIDGGWLLRPAGSDDPVIATLDLRCEPTLSVTGAAERWSAVLTRRHAQILMLLSEYGEAGLTAAALSQIIFGDTGHVVTVRAEMSRLRRAVGLLISSRPYRLTRGVQLRVVGKSDDATEDQAVPDAAGETAPGSGNFPVLSDAGRARLDRPHVGRSHARA